MQLLPRLVEIDATTVTTVQFWQLAAAEGWLLMYTILYFPKQQISAALTVLTVSTLAVNKERSPDFHGHVFERVPCPVPRRPDDAVVVGSVVPPCFVVSSVEVYGVAPCNNTEEVKRRLFSMERRCVITARYNFHTPYIWKY